MNWSVAVVISVGVGYEKVELDNEPDNEQEQNKLLGKLGKKKYQVIFTELVSSFSNLPFCQLWKNAKFQSWY